MALVYDFVVFLAVILDNFICIGNIYLFITSRDMDTRGMYKYEWIWNYILF